MTRKFVVMCAVLCCLGFGFGGCASAPVPPPKSELRQQADDALASGREEYGRRSWSSAALLFQRAAEMYAALDDFASQAMALHNQGQALRKGSRIDAAVDAYDRALAINQKEGRRVQHAENLAGLAQCQAGTGKLDQAIQTMETALELGGDTPTVTATLQNDLALFLLKQNAAANRGRVLELLTAALRANQSKLPTAYAAISHLNLGRAYVEFNELDPALEQLQLALAQFKALDDPIGLAHTHEALAHLALARDNQDQAKLHFQLAREKFAFVKDEQSLRRLDAAR